MGTSDESERSPILGPSFEREFPGASESATAAVIQLILSALQLEGLISRHLRPFDVTMAAVNVLEILRGASDPLPPSVISERRLVTRGTMTSLLDTLERRGLIRRVAHPQDRRMLLVELTDPGHALLVDLMPVLHVQEAHWMSVLNVDEQHTLVDLLGKLRTGLAAFEPPSGPGSTHRTP